MQKTSFSEEDRLKKVIDLGILDTAQEERFDKITKNAKIASICVCFK